MASATDHLKGALKRIPFARCVKRSLAEAIALRRFRREFGEFKNLAMASRAGVRFRPDWQDRYPCLNDRTAVTSFDPHYVYHTAWAARVLARTRPAYHVDISSLLYFSTLVSAFVPVKFYDYRPAEVQLSNLTSERADLLALPFADASLTSLSCMHVIEHIGLGRYGDPLDPDGDLKALAELQRVLAPGGSLLIVVPTGRPRILFNAHRIYSYQQIVSYCSDLTLKEFALVADNARLGLIENATEAQADAQTYGCGCFWFVRLP